MNYLFLAGNVPSSKNSNTWTGKFLVKSKTCQRYIKDFGIQYNLCRENFREIFSQEKPLRIGMYFVRDSKRRFDYINACQIIADLMVKAEWVEDDNADFFVPVFLGYCVDKDNPGVYLVPQQKESFIYELSPNFTLLLK